MSKRRSIGDLVRTKDGAGFTGESMVVKLVDIDEECPPIDSCILNCGDPQCQEWVNVQIVKNGVDTNDYLCHISECELYDV